MGVYYLLCALHAVPCLSELVSEEGREGGRFAIVVGR